MRKPPTALAKAARAMLALAATTIMFASPAAQARERYIILNLADDTQPTSINDKGAVTGVLGSTVGFIWRPDGTVVKFSVPGATFGTLPTSINNKGEVTGRYAAIRKPWHGFVRKPDGTIKTFKFPHDGGGDFPVAVNSGEMVFGYFEHSRQVHGFLRDRNGLKMTFDCPCGATFVSGANDVGAATGDGDEGFIRNPDGTFTLFSAGEFTVAAAINLTGAVTGQIGNETTREGFLRTPDGTTVVFNVPGATNGTIPASINDGNAITGVWGDSAGIHGFIRTADGQITSFDPEGSIETHAVSINNKGRVAGFYYTKAQRIGFVKLPLVWTQEGNLECVFVVPLYSPPCLSLR